MEYTTKLVYQSNYWYNDGLQKAKTVSYTHLDVYKRQILTRSWSV